MVHPIKPKLCIWSREHQKNSNNKTGTQSATTLVLLSLYFIPGTPTPELNSLSLRTEALAWIIIGKKRVPEVLYIWVKIKKVLKSRVPLPPSFPLLSILIVPAPSWQWLWRIQITRARAKGRETSRPVNEAKVHDLLFPLSLHLATAWPSRWQSKLTKAPAFWPKKQRGTPGNQKLLENGIKIQAQESKPINS